MNTRKFTAQGDSEPFTVSEFIFNPNSHRCVCAKSLQSCLTLCNPMDCSLPGSPVHGILQARILEWVAISFSRGSSWPKTYYVMVQLFLFYRREESSGISNVSESKLLVGVKTGWNCSHLNLCPTSSLTIKPSYADHGQWASNIKVFLRWGHLVFMDERFWMPSYSRSYGVTYQLTFLPSSFCSDQSRHHTYGP